MFKPIAIGTEIFHELIESNSYYVDKTPFISTVFEKNTSKVMLITRPRRFGKTLTMSTFYDFLSLDPENPGDTSRQEKWFKDTEILKNAEYKDFCCQYMGKFPVIFISLKNVKGNDFISAYRQFASVVYGMYSEFRYLADSDRALLRFSRFVSSGPEKEFFSYDEQSYSEEEHNVEVYRYRSGIVS